MKNYIIRLVVVTMLCTGCAQNLQSAKVQSEDAFRSPWTCVNEYAKKSDAEFLVNSKKNRIEVRKSEIPLLWNLVPGMMYYRMAKKSFLDKK